MNDIERPLQRVLETYQSAVFAKDLPAFLQIYDPSVRVFDAWGVWSYDGLEAWQIAVEGWFASLGAERVKVTFEDVRSSADRDISCISAIVTYAATSAGGEQLRAMQNRLTWVLRKTGHVMRVIHEHTSAPIGFNDSKAILRRE